MSRLASMMETIISYVEQAETVSDLFSFIQHIPLTALQTFVKLHVQNSSNRLMNQMYHDALPIDTILSHDVMQHILSFNHLSIAQRAANKTLKQLSDKNDLIELKQRNKIIQDLRYEFKIDFQSGTHWVVRTNEHQLSAEELARGYKGPMDLDNALKQCQNEDVLLLYDGEHTLDSDFLLGDDSLSFIGMSDNVIVKVTENMYWYEHGIIKNIYFKNIYLINDRYKVESGDLWMEHCTINTIDRWDSSHTLCQLDGGSLHMKNCYLDGDSLQEKQGTIGIWLNTPHTQVEIIGCTFTNCGNICNDDEVKEYPIIELFVSNKRLDHKTLPRSIEIVGNIFSNNKGRSIVFTDYNGARSQERKENHTILIQSHIASIHHNILQNANGRVDTATPMNEKPNPNQIALGIQSYE
eukprot:239120_1